VYVNTCARNNVVLRTHHLESAASFLRFLQTTSPRSEAKCLVVTGVRDPRTWLPSLYFENNKARLCRLAESPSKEAVVSEYRKWLVSPEVHAALAMTFGATGIALAQRLPLSIDLTHLALTVPPKKN